MQALVENPDASHDLVSLACPFLLAPINSHLSPPCFVHHGGWLLWTPSLGLPCYLMTGWVQSMGGTGSRSEDWRAEGEKSSTYPPNLSSLMVSSCGQWPCCAVRAAVHWPTVLPYRRPLPWLFRPGVLTASHCCEPVGASHPWWGEFLNPSVKPTNHAISFLLGPLLIHSISS